MSTPPAWTPAEIEIVRQHYHRLPVATVAELVSALGQRRTVHAVRRIARRQKLVRHRAPELPRSPDRMRLIRRLYGTVPTTVLAERLGCSVDVLYRVAREQGIRHADQSAARATSDARTIRQLRLMLAVERSLIDVATAARLAGMAPEAFTRAALQEAVRGAKEAT